MANVTLMIDGRKYVAIPEAEFLLLKGGKTSPSAQEDAVAFARANVADCLRRARETARLSQSQLARRLNKSQAMVSRAESGDTSVGERYVAAVLKACKLPKNWQPKER